MIWLLRLWTMDFSSFRKGLDFSNFRKGLMTFRVGPETPEIGELLQTTCVVVEEDEPVEEETNRKRRRREVCEGLWYSRIWTLIVIDHASIQAVPEKSVESLTDLGLCLGDLLPEVRVNYPDEKFFIKVHSIQAPSIVFSAKKGGESSCYWIGMKWPVYFSHSSSIQALPIVKCSRSLQVRPQSTCEWPRISS